MKIKREHASAIEVNNDQTLIIGGIDERGFNLRSTELYSSSGSESGKDFPLEIRYHCSFKINATHAMATGGFHEWEVSGSTWFVDLTTTTFTPGPTMKTKRYRHGCATFQYGGKIFGIVSGGYTEGNELLDPTDIIDFDQESPTWTEGPKLPRGLASLTLVETSQGTYAIGGVDSRRIRRNEVLQLDCPGEQISSCRWEEVGNLQFARDSHVLFALPESYDICRA